MIAEKSKQIEALNKKLEEVETKIREGVTSKFG